ncbi:MAG: carboxypeptidase regulatory-like domain-containing protein [Bacteroidota bacterium]
MKQLKRVIIPILLLVVVSALPLWSGTTGKIAGTVINKANGEPVPGANIVVAGTSLGASTDLNGHYTILYVPPGTYNVQVSFIGFRKITMNDVRVYIDQTARIDFSLEAQEIELSVSVVLGERLSIKPDVATSVASLSNKEVEALPITNVVSAVGLQAGVRGGWGSNPNFAGQPTFMNSYTRGKVSVQGGLSIRGGEGDNILFMVDGVTMRDPRNNEPMTAIALSAVKEVSVERGGFNAEYGQVRSGVVNVVTKEGGKQGYSGSFQVRMSPPGPKYYRGGGIKDLQDPYSYILRPYFDPDVCWTGTGNGAWDQYMQKEYANFGGWNIVSKQLCTDNDPTNDITPVGAQRIFEYETRKKQPNNLPDYDIDAGFGGPIPYIGPMLGNLRFFASYRSTRDVLILPLTRPDFQDYDWTVQVTSDITSSLKLKLSALYGKQFTIRHNWDSGDRTWGLYFYPHYPNEVGNVLATVSQMSDLKNVFSDFNFSLADIGQRSLAAKLTGVLSSNTFYEVSIENFRRDYFTRPPALRDTSALYEVIPGYFEDSNPFGFWPYNYSKSIGITSDVMHICKARDNSVVQATTMKADFTSQVNFQNLVKAGLEFVYNDLNFDYGEISSGTQGKVYNFRTQMHVFPLQAAGYIQDKLEAQGFTVNLGLRLDFSDPHVNWWNLNSFDGNFFSSTYNPEADTFPKQSFKPQWQLSPRLGIAHPVSENSKLFFNYGHFRQVPQYESLFRLERSDQHQLTSFGNPNIALAKTISYELGYDHILFEDYLLQIAAFYNDISNQQDLTHYISTAAGYEYTKATPNNYEDIRGFELTFRKTTGRWWSGFVNYTYQVNTSGHFGSSNIYDNPTDQKRWDQATVNLYQDRPIPQPYARLDLSLFTPEDYGPSVLGHKILGGFRLNIIADWQAGFWTTWNPKALPSVGYNVQGVDYFNTNLRVDKSISIGKFRVQLFMDISNVLNTLRLYVPNDQNQTNYFLSLHLPKSDAYDNILGKDKFGDYRKPGVDWQPEVYQSVVQGQIAPNDFRAYYYEGSTGKYYKVISDKTSPNGRNWQELEQATIDQINNDKAYIDMPNDNLFWFLDPRKIFFGVRLSFDFNE